MYIILNFLCIWKPKSLSFKSNSFECSLRSVQLVEGDPMYPSGHEHTAWWFITWQFAVGAHGLLYAQGLIQSLFSHAVWSGHSSLFAQPAANVASVEGVTILEKCVHALKIYSIAREL